MTNNQNFGLTMIFASLIVMAATGFLLFDYQRDFRDNQARTQGLDLVRLLSGMTWNELIPDAGRKGFLEALGRGQSNPDFAYGAVVDVEGRVATEITRAGVIVPGGTIPDTPTAWLGQRLVSSSEGRDKFIESHAPVFSDGNIRGFVRLGYFEPGYRLSISQLPFLATLTLPIFLLTTLFYLLRQREMKSIGKIGETLEKLAVQGENRSIELQPGEKFSSFIDQFNHFIDLTQQRIGTLDQQQNDLLISSKLLGYKNKRIDSILQNFPEAIMVFDESGEVSYLNAKIERLLEIKADEVIGKKARDWCKNQHILPILTFSDANAMPQSNENLVKLQHEDGSESELQFSVYPLFTPSEDVRVLGHLMVVRDITGRGDSKQRQGEFVSHIAHELKTPLNVLAMYSESLLLEGASNEAHRVEAVNVIHDEVERLSTLINNLLAINQYELGGVVAQRKHVRIHDLLDDAFKNLSQSRGDKPLSFESDIPRDIGSIFVDKDLLRIAINNLLSNAIKYSKPGGVVRLGASEDENSVEIRVSDQGYGIDEEDQAKIFTKFYRSNNDDIRQQTGHGLGLSLAMQIVLMHHGELSFSSIPGEGSEFIIRLEKISSQILDDNQS